MSHPARGMRAPRAIHTSILGGGVLLAALAAFPATAPLARAERPRDQVGNASLGDLRFHARAVPFRHGTSEGRAEFSIRVPYNQLKFVPVDSVFEAKLRITVELRNARGKPAGRKQEEARVQITDRSVAGDSLLGEIYTVGLAVPPGVYRYRATVEDLNVARRGLIYMMKNERRQGTVEGGIDLGPWLFRSPAVSGIVPAWSIAEGAEEPSFAKGPYEVLPQPSGYFGLFRDVVSAYYEIYDSEPPQGGRHYRLSERIQDASGDTLFTGQDSLRVTEGTAWPHALAIDITTLPAGHFQLWLEIHSSDPGSAPAVSVAEFDVLWSSGSWDPFAAEEYEVEAAVLLSSEETLKFRQLHLGDMEARIQNLWRSVDPTPETAENEAYLEFRRRVDHSNMHYTVFERGMLSDRGRVYIRYGEPDDIRIERLPVNDKTLGFAISGEIPRESGERLTKQDSGVVDTRPYEIWTYNFRGKEIVPRRGLSETGNQLKFVFVDEQGYGEYILRYSSTAGMH